MSRRLAITFRPRVSAPRALAFWTEVVGFIVHTDQPFDDNQRWIELRIKGSDTHLALFTHNGHEDRIEEFSSISFHCDKVEKTYGQLAARGVEFTGPPKAVD